MMVAYGLIKLSITTFYRRLFVTNKGTVFDTVSKGMVLAILLWTIAFVLMVIFDCGIEFWANWGSTTAQLKYCPIGFTSEYGLAISDLVLDIFVILLPLPLVSDLAIYNLTCRL